LVKIHINAKSQCIVINSTDVAISDITMAEVEDFVLQLDDSVVADDDHVVEPEPAPAPVPADHVEFHQAAVSRNYTRFELEGSPTVWFDEFNKVYQIYFSF
jgi:hypothetical protein